MDCFSYAGALDPKEVFRTSASKLKKTASLTIDLDDEKDASEDSDEGVSFKKNKRGSKRKKNCKIGNSKKKVKLTGSDDEITIVGESRTVPNATKNRKNPDPLYDEFDDDELEKTLNEISKPKPVNIKNKKPILQRPKSPTIELIESPILTPKKGEQPSIISINIKLAGDSPSPLKLSASIKDTFEKIIDIYCSSQDITLTKGASIKLDGMPLSMSERPMDYQMIDGDTIVIYLNDIVIDPAVKAAASSHQATQSNGNMVTLIVRSKDEQTKFKIGGKDKFKKLFDGYCKRFNVQPNTIKFVFDGDTLDLDSTPEDEDMEDGDIIDVHAKKK